MAIFWNSEDAPGKTECLFFFYGVLGQKSFAFKKSFTEINTIFGGGGLNSQI